MNEYKNILVINFGGIGDEILFLPTLSTLKKVYPNSQITLCLEPRSKSVTQLTDTIDDIITVNIKGKNKYFELLKFLFKVRFSNFDLVLSSGGNKFISVLLFLTGIKTKIGYNTGKLSEKLLTYAVSLNKNQYAVNMYHDLVSTLTDEKTELPEIKVEDAEKEPNSVLIHPGVSLMSIRKNIIKTVPATVWADVIRELVYKGKKVYLAGGPDDAESIKIILDNLKDISSDNFINLYGKTKNLLDLAKLIKKSEILICSDSAPMHIGVGVNTKTLAIFGPTDEKKLLPQNDKFIAIKTNCDCRPCLWDKRQTSCEKLDCLKISAQDICSYL